MSANYGWVIYTKQSLINPFGNNAFDWMKEAAAANGLTVDIVFEEDLNIIIDNNNVHYFHKKQELQKPDFVHLRSYCLELAACLKRLDIKLINNIEALTTARNKWFTHLALMDHKLPQPRSILLRVEEADFEYLETQLAAPFIIKEIYGSKGEQVYLVHSKKEFEILKKKLVSNGHRTTIYQRS